MKNRIFLTVVTSLVFSAGSFAQQPDMKEVLGIVKKNLAASKANLVNYEWVETVTTYYKGEQKSVKKQRCYYSVDGKLTKVEAGGGTPAKTKGGIRGKIAENKKDDMQDYIDKAMAKVKTYLPPDAARIQELFTGGKTTVQVLEPGKKLKLNCPDYKVKGDLLSLAINTSSQKLMMLDVNTYMDKPDEKVLFNLTYGDLPDGTQFAETTTIDAQAKQLKIVIVNSGYKKSSGN